MGCRVLCPDAAEAWISGASAHERQILRGRGVHSVVDSASHPSCALSLRGTALVTVPIMFTPTGSSRVLLASDLDGTLLRSDGELSAASADAVNALVQGGGLFTYATARSFTSASRVTSGLDLRLPVVTYGGAMIVDPANGAARPAAMLSAAVIRAVIDATVDTPTVQPVLFAMHEGADKVCWLPERATVGIEGFLARRPGDPRLMPLDTWSTIDPSAVFSVSLIGERAPLDELRTALAPALDCHQVFGEDIYERGSWWLELTSSAGTKAMALAALKDEIGADQLVCFGDNHNDLPMFAIADHAVAVANAEPEVRAAADEVIGVNDADSVADWIARYTLTMGCGP